MHNSRSNLQIINTSKSWLIIDTTTTLFFYYVGVDRVNSVVNSQHVNELQNASLILNQTLLTWAAQSRQALSAKNLNNHSKSPFPRLSTNRNSSSKCLTSWTRLMRSWMTPWTKRPCFGIKKVTALLLRTRILLRNTSYPSILSTIILAHSSGNLTCTIFINHATPTTKNASDTLSSSKAKKGYSHRSNARLKSNHSLLPMNNHFKKVDHRVG